jgi:hypothetical protein
VIFAHCIFGRRSRILDILLAVPPSLVLTSHPSRESEDLNDTMISNTSDVPTLAGGFINLDMIKRPTDVASRRSKIICTLGPACWEVHQLETLIDAGMNVARFNFSHGDHEGHLAVLKRLREAATNKNRNIGE